MWQYEGQKPVLKSSTITVSFPLSVSSMTYQMKKKRSERRKHCALAVVKRDQKISLRRRPPSRGGGQDG